VVERHRYQCVSTDTSPENSPLVPARSTARGMTRALREIPVVAAECAGSQRLPTGAYPQDQLRARRSGHGKRLPAGPQHRMLVHAGNLPSAAPQGTCPQRRALAIRGVAVAHTARCRNAILSCAALSGTGIALAMELVGSGQFRGCDGQGWYQSGKRKRTSPQDPRLTTMMR